MDKETQKQLQDRQQSIKEQKKSGALYMRDIIGLKAQMDKRTDQRGVTLYYLSINKLQTALIHGRQLLFTSSKVYKQFQDYYQKDFQELFFYRTSKMIQYLQYLLDCALICKVFIVVRKKEDLMEMFQKFQLMDMEVQNISNSSQKEIIKFNQYHQIHAKTCAVLLTFIELAKNEKLIEYVQKFYKMYLAYVEKFYTSIQYATALFKYANYLYQYGQIQKAEIQYDKCMKIRSKNALNQSYVDVLVNYAICKSQNFQLDIAIEKMLFAIEISKDIRIENQRLSQLYLFLAKLYLLRSDFDESYQNMLRCYKIRQLLQRNDPSRIQIEIDLLFLMKTLKDVIDNPGSMINMKFTKQLEGKKKKAQQVQKKMKIDLINRQDFAKYKQFKSSKTAHLTLEVSAKFYQLLTAAQTQQLRMLQQKLPEISYQRGITQLKKCSFYKQIKTRIAFLEQNSKVKEVNKY